MNSFRHVHRALEFEIQRQQDLLQDGEDVVQETRLYDDEKGVTRTMRGKEEAHDYRYFPDPDLVPLQVSPDETSQWKAELPELPMARFGRFVRDYGLPRDQARILTDERDLADYYERLVALCEEPKAAANWMSSEMIRELREMRVSAAESPLSPKNFAALLNLVHKGTISTKIGKQIFPDVFRRDLDPEAHIQDKGLVQISDQTELDSVVDEVLEENPDEVQAFRGGKKKLASFFMGQVMKKTKGQANPKLVNELLLKKLGPGE
jgi:aspartyl-tRNA(Asn)/glutamyl-tRNA(Gln) amidotransferase subunit B